MCEVAAVASCLHSLFCHEIKQLNSSISPDAICCILSGCFFFYYFFVVVVEVVHA